MLRGGLLPAAHLYPAPAEEVGFAAGNITHLLHVAGVARVGGDGGKADEQVVEAQLLAVQFVHGVLESAGGVAVHLHFVGAAQCTVAEAGLVVVGVHDAYRPAGSGAAHGILGPGAVVRKTEEGGVVIVAQADAGIGGGLPDLLAGGELGVFVGNVAAAAVPVGHMGMGGRVEVALAADVQTGVVVDADELGAGGAFAVVVVQRLPGHQQLQELVPAGAHGPHLGDAVGVAVHGTEASDAALHLALDEQVSGRKAPLRAGVLPLGIADVVDHHAHDAAAAAVGLAGQRVSVVGRQPAGRGRFLRCCGRCGGLTGSRCLAGGCRLRGCRGRAVGELLPQPVGKAAANGGRTGGPAAGQRQRSGRQPGQTKNGTASDLFHRKYLLQGKRIAAGSGTACPEKSPNRICFDCNDSVRFCKEELVGKKPPSRLRRDRSVA